MTKKHKKVFMLTITREIYENSKIPFCLYQIGKDVKRITIVSTGIAVEAEIGCLIQ